MQSLWKSECRDSIHYTEISGFGDSSLVSCNFLYVNAEYFCGCHCVNVFSGSESGYQVLVAAQMSHYPELDLRIISWYDPSIFATRYECLAYLFATFCTYRYVLQVGFWWTQSSGGRKCLIESSMYFSCDWGYIWRERLYICREQLLYTSIFQDLIDDRMLVRQWTQSFFICRIAVSDSCFRLDLGIELHLLEKKYADLLRRHNVQVWLFSHLPYLFLDFVHFRGQGRRIFAKLCQIYLHSFHLHTGQYRHQRLLHCAV